MKGTRFPQNWKVGYHIKTTGKIMALQLYILPTDLVKKKGVYKVVVIDPDVSQWFCVQARRSGWGLETGWNGGGRLLSATSVKVM